MLLDKILANLAGVGDQLLVLLVLSLIDLVFGVLAALRAGNFKLEKLAGVLESDLFPIIGWLGVVAIAAIPQDLVPSNYVGYLPEGAYGLVFIKIAGSILGSVSSFGLAVDTLKKIGVQAKQPKPEALRDDYPHTEGP